MSRTKASSIAASRVEKDPFGYRISGNEFLPFLEMLKEALASIAATLEQTETNRMNIERLLSPASESRRRSTETDREANSPIVFPQFMADLWTVSHIRLINEKSWTAPVDHRKHCGLSIAIS
jgi:hypothetical protein